MKPYPKYKPSGIDWLGDIPEEWEVKRVKYLLKTGNNGIKIGPFGSSLKSSIIKTEGYKVYGQENVIRNNFNLGSRYVDQLTYHELQQYELFTNDIIITMMGTTGKTKVVPDNIKKGIMDSHLIRLRLENEQFRSSLFTILINDSNYIQTQIKLHSNGSIMEGLNSSIIKSLLIVCPTLTEQQAISDYLDKKTSLIDSIIEKCNRQIELLGERRAAVINQAVTGKIDLRNWNPSNPNQPLQPYPKYKPSGIDWLGDIPEEWEVSKLGFESSMIVPMRDKPKEFGGSIPWIRIEDFDGKYISASKSDQMISNEIISIMNIKVYPIGTVLCSCSCNMGVTAIATVPLASNQTFIGIVPNKSLLGDYIYYYMNSNSIILQKIGSGAVQQYLSRENFEKFPILIPALEEQKVISDYLDKTTSTIDQAISSIEIQINLLQEYRSSLISQVVTGKYDVRGEV